jgi:hypothetical protein
MKKFMARVAGVALLLCAGCSMFGAFPHEFSQEVRLDHANYKIVKSNIIADSTGFGLIGLGFTRGLIPILPPRYAWALDDLWSEVGQTEGRSLAMVNVVTEEGGLNLLVITFPRVTVRADVIEFTNAP